MRSEKELEDRKRVVVESMNLGVMRIKTTKVDFRVS